MEGVAGLDVVLFSMARPSSSSIALLLCGFSGIELSSGGIILSDCMQGLVRLTSFSSGSDTSDGALLPHLGLLPVPALRLSRLLLLTRVWYSCSGMLVPYLILALFFSIVPSLALTLALAPARPFLLEFFWSVMLTGVFWFSGWGSRSLGCVIGGMEWF